MISANYGFKCVLVINSAIANLQHFLSSLLYGLWHTRVSSNLKLFEVIAILSISDPSMYSKKNIFSFQVSKSVLFVLIRQIIWAHIINVQNIFNIWFSFVHYLFTYQVLYWFSVWVSKVFLNSNPKPFHKSLFSEIGKKF